jgi:peptide/nickel transport system ATP-binding protein
VRELLSNAGHPYTHALLAGTSDPDSNNAKSYKEVPPGEPPSLVNPPAGCRFHPRCAQIIKGECDVNVPVEIEIEPGHQISCWLHKK